MSRVMATPRAPHRDRRIPRGLFATLVASLAALALAPAAWAAPTLSISSPTNDSVTRNPTPTFSGTTSVELIPPISPEPVKLRIYRGEGTTEPVGAPLVAAQTPFTTEWTAQVIEPLAEGTYTAVAEQSEGGERGTSSPVTFTVAPTPPPPHVTITYPANDSSATGDSQLLTGAAGVAPHDGHEVTVELFAGATPAPPTLAILHVPASGAAWSAVFGGLGPGTYTAQAVQYTDAGNAGTSAPVTFTLSAPPPPPAPPPPSASFTWFPQAPAVGQNVVLVSSATDAASPITSFAWDLAGGGPFQGAGPVLATSFASAGNHLVRLRVIDARGLSSVASATISVAPVPLRPMQPFPIVRFAGVETSSGVRLSLLSVQAPVGARVSVTCRGRGCATKPQSRLASASKRNRHASWVLLSFRAFEREFRAGVTLEVRVAAAGEVGKYTLFSVRRHSLPTRVDSCLAAFDPRPIACAS
jgi:hypothetical protein